MKLKDYNIINWKEKKVKVNLQVNHISVFLLEIDTSLLPPREGIRNLAAVDDKENIVWMADLPSLPYAYYNDIKIIENKLFAWVGSTLCEIDIKTGKVLSQELVK